MRLHGGRTPSRTAHRDPRRIYRAQVRARRKEEMHKALAARWLEFSKSWNFEHPKHRGVITPVH